MEKRLSEQCDQMKAIASDIASHVENSAKTVEKLKAQVNFLRTEMSGIKRARDSLSDELVAAKKARDEKSCDLDTSKKACDALSSELAKSKKAYDLLTNQLGAVKKESREQASEMFNILAARDEAVSRAHQLEVELAKVNREAAAGRKLREIWNACLSSQQDALTEYKHSSEETAAGSSTSNGNCAAKGRGKRSAC